MFFGGGHPFGDMFGGGGPFGHGGQDSDSDGGGADNEEYYKLLGIERNATEREIKKAFKKAAMKHHPDRGGDEETFKKCEKAKNVLMDPEKRRLYDRFGEKGVEAGGGRSMDPFASMFGGGRRGGGGGRRGPSKCKPITQTLDITLEDVFKGATVQKSWTIDTAERKNVCSVCDGRGVKKVLLRQGGMVLQTQRQCTACNGQGTSYVGRKKVPKTGPVHVPVGIRTGGKVTLEGDGNSMPGQAAGDVVFTVRVARHPIFKREGADLGCQQFLTLAEALCGYSFQLKHVSGKVLNIKSQPGEIVKPGCLKVLKGYGLPQKGSHWSKGALYIKFDIIFPLARPVQEDVQASLQKALEGLEYPEQKREIVLEPGVRIKVKLAANAAERIYRERRAMEVQGVIAGDHESSEDAWAVELDAFRGFPSKSVVVPKSWVFALEAKSGATTGANKTKKKGGKGKKKKKRRRKNKAANNQGGGGNAQQQGQAQANQGEDGMPIDEDEEEEEEDVTLETVEGDRPKPTPASAGDAAAEEEEAERRGGGGDGGVQCQQM